MPSTPDDPLQSQSPASDGEVTTKESRLRPKSSPLSSINRLPYRRSNASLSSLFASTSSLPTSRTAGSPSESGTATPTSSAIQNGSVFSPGGSTISVRSSSPATWPGARGADTELNDLILRAFSPHVSILASPDTEELVRHKGVHGGLLELLRPFGEHVTGKVTIRDSAGISRSWEDFAVRFVGVKDGLENPRPPPGTNRSSVDSDASRPGTRNGQRASMLEYKPARLRTGGDVPQVEELVERHLTFAEEQSGPGGTDYINHDAATIREPHATSPFYKLYLKSLLSGLPVVPSETISHPVASVIAISSRNPAPIEELRNLYASSNTGEHRLPQWVHNEFLRYYILVHDEDYDDISKSMALYDQMKRHFGLHCHLLRLRSKPCSPDDPDSVQLQTCEWTAAAEELAEIVRRESLDDDEDDAAPVPYLHESDVQAISAFVREMVTQSIIPSMERSTSTWNDQVASRRRGISGRFMSLSKRFAFGGGGGNRNSSALSIGTSGGTNYDSLQGFYRPDAPEAIMRKLADYAMMLRDWKLAYSTFEVLCADFKSDKAWRYYAAANEMAVISSLLAANASTGASAKVRVDVIDNFLESAYYSYITRGNAPYNALRTLLLGVELLKMRGGPALDEAAKWCNRILDDRLVGPVGHVLVMERIASAFAEHRGHEQSEDRRRKASFWNALAADAWLRMEKTGQAESSLEQAISLYGLEDGQVRFDGIEGFLRQLQQAVKAARLGPQQLLETQILDQQEDEVETLQQVSDPLQAFRASPIAHRKSLSVVAASMASSPAAAAGKRSAVPPPLPALQIQTQTAPYDPLGAMPSVYEGSAVAEQLSARPSIGGLRSPLSPDHSSTPPMSPRFARENDGFE